MDKAIQFLLWHGYAVLFAFVFAEQIGLPLGPEHYVPDLAICMRKNPPPRTNGKGDLKYD